MAKTKSHYLAQMQDAWTRGIETARKTRPLSEEATKRLRAHSAKDLHDTIEALMEETGAIKSNGKARTWADDEPVWAAWARWYPEWVLAEIERALPDIATACALDKEALRRDRDKDAKAAQARVFVAERVVDQLATGTKTHDQLAAALYPPKAHKARQALKRLTAMLDGLGVIGTQKCRDGKTRWALWRSLWPEDREALAGG